MKDKQFDFRKKRKAVNVTLKITTKILDGFNIKKK